MATGIPKLGDGKFVAVHSKFDTGHVLNLDGSLYTSDQEKGQDKTYKVFDNLDHAERYAAEALTENANLEICIYDGEGEFVKVFQPPFLPKAPTRKPSFWERIGLIFRNG